MSKLGATETNMNHSYVRHWKWICVHKKRVAFYKHILWMHVCMTASWLINEYYYRQPQIHIPALDQWMSISHSCTIGRISKSENELTGSNISKGWIQYLSKYIYRK